MTYPQIVNRHRRTHPRPDKTVEDCWDCGREKSVCHRKVTYNDPLVAEAEAQRLNMERNWERPVTRYKCNWCDQWHLTSIKPGATGSRAKRVERARRKTLWDGVVSGEPREIRVLP